MPGRRQGSWRESRRSLRPDLTLVARAGRRLAVATAIGRARHAADVAAVVAVRAAGPVTVGGFGCRDGAIAVEIDRGERGSDRPPAARPGRRPGNRRRRRSRRRPRTSGSYRSSPTAGSPGVTIGSVESETSVAAAAMPLSDITSRTAPPPASHLERSLVNIDLPTPAPRKDVDRRDVGRGMMPETRVSRRTARCGTGTFGLQGPRRVGRTGRSAAVRCEEERSDAVRSGTGYPNRATDPAEPRAVATACPRSADDIDAAVADAFPIV